MLFTFAYEAAGASAPGIPCALCFLEEREFLQNLGADVPREGEVVSEGGVIASASEAIQSFRRGIWIASSLTLLAMTGRAKASLFLLRFLRQAIEPILHVLHLPAQVVDIVFRHGLGDLFGCPRHRVSLRHERLEHRER